MPGRKLGVRWILGDVSPRGFVALGLSIWGAWKLFGPEARLRGLRNTVPIGQSTREGRGPARGRDWIDAAGVGAGVVRAVGLMVVWRRGLVGSLLPLQFFPDR